MPLYSIPTNIQSLPNELLTIIFEELVEIYVEDQVFIPIELCELRLVCKAWCTTIENSCTLWSYLCGTETAEQVEKILLLSKHAPLSLNAFPYLNDDNAMSGSEIVRILWELRRLSAFQTTISESSWPQVSTLLCNNAPLLESLRMSVSAELGGPVPALPDALFNMERPPRLKVLNLEGCSVSWSSPLLCNLTELGLHGQPTRPSYSRFHAMLAQMPMLESLELFGCLPEKTPSNASEITMPNLCQVTLWDDIDRCTTFLKYTRCSLLKLDIGLRSGAQNFKPFFDLCEIRLGVVQHTTVFEPVLTTSSCHRSPLLSLKLGRATGLLRVLGRSLTKQTMTTIVRRTFLLRHAFLRVIKQSTKLSKLLAPR
ncbi:hypothetical protein AB1N83_006733 [Pleurotus pulmonarius]